MKVPYPSQRVSLVQESVSLGHRRQHDLVESRVDGRLPEALENVLNGICIFVRFESTVFYLPDEVSLEHQREELGQVSSLQ